MDRVLIESHLAECHQHVALGEEHIAKQHWIIGNLERRGHDTKAAFRQLRLLEEMQVQHVGHRDRLQVELGKTVGSAEPQMSPVWLEPLAP